MDSLLFSLVLRKKLLLIHLHNQVTFYITHEITVIYSRVQIACASTTSCSGYSGDRNIWIGVTCSGAATTAAQVISSPSSSLGWSTSTAVTTVFTPGAAPWAASNEPDPGETSVRMILSGTGTASTGYSVTGWRGISSTQTYNFGIW